MSRSGLEIDRDTGNIIREGCGSCVVKVWVETSSFTGAGYYKDPDYTGESSKPKKKEVTYWKCGCPVGEHKDDCPVYQAKFSKEMWHRVHPTIPYSEPSDAIKALVRTKYE